MPKPIQHLHYHNTSSNEKLEILKQKEYRWEKGKNNYIETGKNFWEDKETYLTNESENKVVDGDISI